MNKTVYIIIFLIFSILNYLFSKQDTQDEINKRLEKQTLVLTQEYNLIFDQYKKIANIIFLTRIDTPEVKKIFAQANDASELQKEQVRKELYESLKNTYALLKQYNLKQLHFHLKNNDSFLRFHKPEKFGDNLSDVRATVKYVNETHKAIAGFEEGRMYNGYRFVFPLFLEGKYLGSVEISFSTLAMSMEFFESHRLEGRFLIAKKVVAQKVFDYARSNYISSPLPDFYSEKATEEVLRTYTGKEFTIPKRMKEQLEEKAFSDDSFSLYDEKNYVVYTFLKIMNPISKNVVAIYVIKDEKTYINQIKKDSFALFLALELFFAIFLVVIFRMRYEKKLLHTEIANKTSELQAINAKMQDYIDLIDQNVITSSTDLHGKITEVSQAFCQISGYSREELIGANHNMVRHRDMSPEFFRHLWRTIKNNEVFKGEIKNQKKDGNYYWVDTVISARYDENGEKIGYTAIRQDITNKKKIEEISIRDALTQIYNRHHFNYLFPKLINGAKRENGYIAFLMIDIDFFKQYNDTYGHLQGDAVLQKVAFAMKKSLKRASDFCFRLGGEEFAVIYKVKGCQEAYIFADELRRNIEGLEIEHKNNTVSEYVTISVGLMCLKATDIEKEMSLYEEADKLLYVAKEKGRNRVESNFSS